MEEVVFRDGAGGDAFGRVVCEGAVFLEEAAVGGGLGHGGQLKMCPRLNLCGEERVRGKKRLELTMEVGVWLEIESFEIAESEPRRESCQPDNCGGGVEVRTTFRGAFV